MDIDKMDMCYQKDLGEKMNNKDWWPLVSDLADWIDTRAKKLIKEEYRIL
jgi:hypothetical protein